ncbi:nesprin-2 isoform X2 [Solea solea]|uniref:nesprin-2 isoform X2 n=1 Tax=Solea solea TaxID=90069 RepID=UPI00272A208E|nr:nesprin-2 isoform X2 [Solea solea]
MSGCLESDRYGDVLPAATGGDVSPAEDVGDAGSFLGLSQSSFIFTSSLLESSDGSARQEDVDGSGDGDLRGCGQLETRWVLWHKFMKEHAHLDAWLRLAEHAIDSPNSAPVTYTAAREQLRMFERLRSEAGSRLVQLDGLTHRNRTLTRLFFGAMRSRLLALARECGRRWDDVNAQLESVTARLKHFVSEWEGFEAEGEELALWLANLDVRLTEVDHLNDNTCEKLRRLQSFQQCVCENSGRVNALLQRGEELILRSEPSDAQRIESHLLELLRHCSQVYNNIARTHTRLLSMRLVFDNDWIWSQASDSGCPSETLFEEEGVFDKPHLDVPALSEHLKDFSQSAPPTLPPSDSSSPVYLPPPTSSSPVHEHLGLEWDPSVDIGRSVSCDDSDSSYFSGSTGRCHRGNLKRWSYLSCQSDISHDNTDQEAAMRRRWLDHAHPGIFSPAATKEAESRVSGERWATSTPDRCDSDPISFGGRRVRAWLGVQSPAPSEGRTLYSKAVQTDEEVKGEEESSCCVEEDCHFSEKRATATSGSSFVFSSPSHLALLLVAALALLISLVWVVQESPCHRSSRVAHGYHLTLRYVNGPPPT